jgi:hypothetical protein
MRKRSSYRTKNATGTSISDDEFIEIWNKHKSAGAMHKDTGIVLQAINKRRRKIEQRYSITLETIDRRGVKYIPPQISQKVRFPLTIENGVVIIGSDAHYWPGMVSTAHRGLVKLTHRFKPVAVIQNGDVIDGATISRWPRIGWEHRPTVKQELEVAQERLSEIEKASLNSKCFWTFGNHDARFELNLAKLAPEYEGVAGFTLKEHFPRWQPCMSVMVNNDTMIKHRQANGIHAVYNNTVKGGITMVTGHLHSLKVTPWTDYNGDRYGVDSGTLADPWGPQFEAYMEDGTRNWRSGFVVLTWIDGRLMPPELAHVLNEGQLYFRGEVIEV